MKEPLAIGLMSGSSLDGLDLALVRFTNDEGRYSYAILEAETMPYPTAWCERLAKAFLSKPEDLKPLDLDYGTYLGQCVASFAKKHNAKPDFIASHGHTVFHRPEKRYTLQIGNGQAIADSCGFLTINDFRTEDVLKGGQGAPLVPIGDKLLFGDYDICLNIGGIANLSYNLNGRRIAYDICIANQALNWLAQHEGFDYDKDGVLARSGKIDEALLNSLNDHEFYRQKPPKSLGREFFESNQKQQLGLYATKDAMSTFVEHIAMQIGQSISSLQPGKMLVTGGGAHNTFLIERIQHYTKHLVVVPDNQTVDYKEALIFAFLGLLRLEGRPNVLCSVTGAPSDSCSGHIWHPKAIKLV